MMRYLLPLCAAGLFLATASATAAAECVSSGQASAAVLDTADPNVGARNFVTLGVWLGAITEHGFEADLAKMGSACERARFTAGGSRYVLRGENEGAAAARVALPASRRAPTAYLLAIPDIIAGLKPGHTGPTPISGYALMTAANGRHLAWRIYDAIPSDAMLLADMRSALDGRIRALMSWEDGRVKISMPPKAS